jgi:hypothetical protein
MRSVTAFFAGFGVAAALASTHDPVGMVLAALMLVGAAAHEWLARKDEAEAAREQEDARG